MDRKTLNLNFDELKKRDDKWLDDTMWKLVNALWFVQEEIQCRAGKHRMDPATQKIANGLDNGPLQREPYEYTGFNFSQDGSP